MTSREPLRGHQVICSGIIEKNGKYLMVFCPKFEKWRVPGGCAEWQETIEETFVREMEEEIGVTLNDYKLLGFGQDHDVLVDRGNDTSRLLFFFHAKTDEELTFDPTEASDHKWVTFDELKTEKNKEGALDDFFARNPDLILN